jgi:uncharacterized protein YciI
MICVRTAYSAPDRTIERGRFLEAHKDFLRSGRLTVLQSGPIFDQDGNQTGGIIVAEVSDIAGMEAICAKDPFVVHGVYDRITFAEWRITLGHIPQTVS